MVTMAMDVAKATAMARWQGVGDNSDGLCDVDGHHTHNGNGNGRCKGAATTAAAEALAAAVTVGAATVLTLAEATRTALRQIVGGNEVGGPQEKNHFSNSLWTISEYPNSLK